MNLTALAIAASCCLLAVAALPPGLLSFTFAALGLLCLFLLWREGAPRR